MKFAYLTKSNTGYGTLHIDSKETADASSFNGKVIATDFPTIQGYPSKKEIPVVEGIDIDLHEEHIYRINSLEEAVRTGNEKLVELYASVM